MKRFIEQSPTVLGIPAGSAVLAVVPHPDDEFMIGGSLDTFEANDITAHAVVAGTDDDIFPGGDSR